MQIFYCTRTIIWNKHDENNNLYGTTAVSMEREQLLLAQKQETDLKLWAEKVAKRMAWTPKF